MKEDSTKTKLLKKLLKIRTELTHAEMRILYSTGLKVIAEEEPSMYPDIGTVVITKAALSRFKEYEKFFAYVQGEF